MRHLTQLLSDIMMPVLCVCFFFSILIIDMKFVHHRKFSFSYVHRQTFISTHSDIQKRSKIIISLYVCVYI